MERNNISIPKELHKEYKEEVDKQGKKIRAVTEKLVEEWIQKMRKERGEVK